MELRSSLRTITGLYSMSNFKRLSKFAILPQRGETAENIMEFDDIWDVSFGDVGVIKQHMGDSNHNQENPNAVCIHFRTGNVTEVEVGFRTTQDMYGFFIGAHRAMILSDHPWANFGDEGNIKEVGRKSNTQSVVTYMTANNKDPRGNRTVQGFGTDGSKGMSSKTLAKRPDGTGLMPNTDYWVTHRIVNPDNTSMEQRKISYPITVTYVGTDDPEQGGEQFIANAPSNQPSVPAIPESENSLTVTIAGIEGVWTPLG